MRSHKKIDRDSIRRILTEWNPIGIPNLPIYDTEYDGYITTILRLLREDADLYKMTEYLFGLDTVNGKAPGAKAKCESVAKLLLELKRPARRADSGT